MADEFDPATFGFWPACTVADCCNLVCLGLSDTLCFPHYFELPMDREGAPVFPSRERREECYRLLEQALEKA